MKLYKRNSKSKKIANKVVIISLIITFFACLFYIKITKKITDNMVQIANNRVTKFLYSYVTNYIYDTCLKEQNYDKLLILNYSDEEIKSVDYDLKKTYVVLNNITNALNDAVNNLEKGKINTNIDDEYLKSTKHGLILYLPLGILSDKIYLTNLGPKIPVKINFLGKELSNIKTKVTDYGLNNGLLEIYVTITLSGEIISPVNKKDITFNYDVLIAATVVNGKVPSYYGYNT